MSKVVAHIHRTNDATPEERELTYQALARARKCAQELVDKLGAAMDRTKAGQGAMNESLAREVESIIRPALNKVI